jgi:CRP-like cAMP-binding protein
MTAPERIPLDAMLRAVGQLPTGAQVRLHDCLKIHDLAVGDVLFFRGSEGGSVYIVDSGEVSLWWEAPNGDHELLRFAGAGDVVTPGALLDRSPRQRSCLVEQDARVIELSFAAFQVLTARDPMTACSILEGLGRCAAGHPDSQDPAYQDTWLDSLPAPC